MLAALTRLLTGQPEGVLRHLALYGALVQAETGYAAQHLARRAAFAVVALILLGCGVTLAGVAALLVAAGLVVAAPVAFWAIPGLVLAAALVAGWLATREASVPPYDSLRRQLAADAGWLAQATSGEPAGASDATGTPRPPQAAAASGHAPHANDAHPSATAPA